MNKIIEVKDVSFGYDKNLILDRINFSVEEGEFVAIVGENGAGKSTLMKLIIGQLKPESGEILFNYQDRIGYVPQLSAAISNNFPITVEEIMSLSLKKSFKDLMSKDSIEEKKIDIILNIVGLEGKKNFLYGDLSGGQKQKIMLGKALITNPKLLLLDEPLIGLDQESKDGFLKMLHHQSREHGITIMMITHELDYLKEYLDKVLILEEGEVKEGC